MANQKPIHEIRIASIKAAIWKNDTPKGARYNVTVCRLYKEDNQWKQAESFGRLDLPVVGQVIDRAHAWILEQSV